MTTVIKLWKKYNKLTIIKEVNKKWKYNIRHVQCKCECWNIKEIWLSRVINWFTKSCWCIHKQIVAKVNFKHWEYKNRFYKIWYWITRRCTHKNNPLYKDYGWRWIKNKWKNFEEFKNDMYKDYLIHFEENNWDTTIERGKVNWNYDKNNCTWATQFEQAQNRRNSRLFFWKSVRYWSDLTWIKITTLQNWLYEWKIDKWFLINNIIKND